MHPLEEFKELGLTDEIIQSIKKFNFTTPTSIQCRSVPKILEGTDLLVEAQTGTGKTACFAWPLLQMLDQEKKELALILTPTRELAIQVSGAVARFGEFIVPKLSVVTLIGGESIEQQTIALDKGADIVVATPGRLLDLLRQNALSLRNLKFLVLDEADKIMDLGFAAELDLILSELPSTRQNLFFSATYPEKVLEIVKRISKNPEHLKIEDELPTVDSIIQRVIQVNQENRGMLLRHLIKTEKLRNGLVFVASKTAARNLSEKLKKAGISATAIHGDLSQSERNQALSDFKARKVSFLIATDVAARGIDINRLSLVINFDLPRSPADYIHRIGRTGRAGEKGLAISFIGHEDQEHFLLIEKRAQIRLSREAIVGFELKGNAPIKPKGQAPVKGKRMSKKDKAREAAKSKMS